MTTSVEEPLTFPYNSFMKIVFTGGQTGGHFYPIISVVQELRRLIREEHLIEPTMYFMAPDPYNKGILFDNGITYKRVMSGKQRVYPSIFNFLDKFKILQFTKNYFVTFF